MEPVSVLMLLLIGVALQIAVVGIAVHLGTASVRRELLELRHALVFLERD